MNTYNEISKCIYSNSVLTLWQQKQHYGIWYCGLLGYCSDVEWMELQKYMLLQSTWLSHPLHVGNQSDVNDEYFCWWYQMMTDALKHEGHDKFVCAHISRYLILQQLCSKPHLVNVIFYALVIDGMTRYQIIRKGLHSVHTWKRNTEILNDVTLIISNLFPSDFSRGCHKSHARYKNYEILIMI